MLISDLITLIKSDQQKTTLEKGWLFRMGKPEIKNTQYCRLIKWPTAQHRLKSQYDSDKIEYIIYIQMCNV